MLTSLIDNVVRQAGYTLNDLDGVAVAQGPGSYTGLRIGVSTAKGLCFALDKPLIAINTLRAMAEQLLAFSSCLASNSLLLCPMIDARRMEVYCALYDREGREIEPTVAKIIDEYSFTEQLTKQPVLFFGDGAAKCRPILGRYSNANFNEVVIQPSARTIGLLATPAYNAGEFENLASFEPFYLKDFMATKPRKLV